eukprot:GHVN01059911.1.p1 GENE.GHVN01059911.1~~GHVN01059911.1.p1  ORF type:complete len:267 (-),score=27.89 GHVN01059911.1:108-908(-)
MEIGKESFAYAWILDAGSDERERGVTIDVAVKHFETESKVISILDAPGHRDFVPNMLAGAAQADVALLVVDAIKFDERLLVAGQTREHLQLVRALGVSKLIVAINKLEKHDWSEEIYNKIKDVLLECIVGPEVGYKNDAVVFLPVSAFHGVNISSVADCDALSAWYKGPTLVTALDRVEVMKDEARESKPLRACVSDVWVSGKGVKVSCKIDSGTLSVKQSVLIMPGNEVAVVRAIELRGSRVSHARAGDYIDTLSLQTLITETVQ